MLINDPRIHACYFTQLVSLILPFEYHGKLFEALGEGREGLICKDKCNSPSTTTLFIRAAFGTFSPI